MTHRHFTGGGFGFTTYHTHSEVVSDWKDHLPQGHHLLGADVEAIEKSQPQDMSFRYISVYREDKWVAAIYVQCLNFSARHLGKSHNLRFLRKGLAGLLKHKSYAFLVCGNLFRVDFQGFWFADKHDRTLIFDCLKYYAGKCAGETRFVSILVKDCSRSFSPAQFSCHGFKPYRHDLTMELVIRPEWKTFDDYLKELTRKYRQRARRIADSSEGIERRELDLPQLEQYASEMQRLYMNIVGRQRFALGILKERYYTEMKAALNGRFRVCGYFYGEKLIAYSSRIFYPEQKRMEIHYIGLDYAYNERHNLYFNILFDGIREAIESGFRVIEMGRTAKDAKASAGARAVENLNYIRFSGLMLPFVFRLLSSRFEDDRDEAWKNRHPFKTSS